MDLVQRFKQALYQGDSAALRHLFTENPGLKSRIDEPLFDFDGPAIVVAAAHGKREVVSTLLELGADINARSKWWAGSFGVLDNDRHELAGFLIERGATVDAYAAARHGMIDQLRDFVAASPGVVNMRGGDGQTPLHVAATAEIARLLLDHGAAIDALDVDHESTPAQYLIRSHPEVVRFLIERGCQTDILMASAVGDLALVQRHLDADPESIRTRVDSKYFPMRNPRAGGTIYFWTLGGNRSALQVAHSFGQTAVLELLFRFLPEDLKLAQACLTSNAEMVREMMAQDPEKFRVTARANPHYVSDAAEDNNGDAVRLMLEAGWPPEGDGRHTPLHWLCWHGNAEAVRAILPFHPPLEALDAEFHGTPLGWTMHGSENSRHKKDGDYAGVIRALLDAGAKRPEQAGGSEAVRKALGA